MFTTRSTIILLAVVISVSYLFWFHTETACNIRDGRWASNGSYCISRDCYDTNSCGSLASPIHQCSNLSEGMPISDVYFQLGEPDVIAGNMYTWHAYKVNPGKIEATIDNGTLTSLSCNAK